MHGNGGSQVWPYRVRTVVVVLAMGASSVALASGGDDSSLADDTSAYVKDYLSDPRRAGSLVGSILGGALTAHPAGPMVGGVIGFLIGKQTMFEDGGKRAAIAQGALRPIVPPAGGGVGTLSFAEPQGGVVGDEPAIRAVAPAAIQALALPSPQAPTAGRAAFVPPVAEPVELAPQPIAPPPAVARMGREQITALCAGRAAAPVDPRLRGACFYAQTQ